MKKINLVLCLFIILLFITSCNKTFKKEKAEVFIDEIYKCIESGKPYCLIDVRKLNEEYAIGHFKGFINYDIENGSVSEFVYKIESMYSKDKTLFIIDKDGSQVSILKDALKKAGYHKINIYLGGYDELLKANHGDFEIEVGIDNCGC